MLLSFKLLRNKKFAILLIVFLVITIGYAVNANYYYPKLNDDAVQLFIKDKQHISDQENAVYSIIGLNAPDGIQNIHAFGLNLMNETLDKCLDADRKRLSLDARLPAVENELTLNADADKLHCWQNNENDETNNGKCEIPNESTCYTESELSQIVKNNNTLLKRHDQIKQYKKYDDNTLLATNASLLINVHRLYLASIRLNLEQGHEEILKVLIHDLEYHRDLMSQPGTMIDKAIRLVLYNLSLEQLEHVITQHTDVALKYKNDLDVVLSELTIEEFNIDGIFRKEFETLNRIYCLDERIGIDTPDFCQNDSDMSSISENYIINDFYKFYLSYKSMLNLDMRSMIEQCSIYSNKPEENIYIGMLFHLPILSTYTSYSLVLGGMRKGCELMVSHKQKALKHVELKAYLNSAKNNSDVLYVQ